MKFKILLILILIAAIGTGGFFGYKYLKKKTSNNLSSEITEEQKPKIKYNYTKTTYFAVVTGFKNKPLNITSADLSKANIFAIQEDIDLLKKLELFTTTTFTPIATTIDLVKEMNNRETAIGIQSLDNLSFKLKTLAIDNQFIFDRTTDLEKYPLKVTQNLASTVERENITNFDPKQLTKLGHTGSLIPARGVQYWMEKKFKNDYTTMFKSTKPLLDTMDFVSATFEAPVFKNGRFCESCMVLVGPDKFMEGVKYSGIDLFSLAANHMMDAGVDGIANTQTKLNELGIKNIGASTVNNDEAGKPVLVEVNGIKIAYLGFNDSPGLGAWARDNKPGAATISDPIYDSAGNIKGYAPNEERIKYFLQRAKDLKPDYIFVITHWGFQEYNEKPLAYTKTLAKLLTDNGADIILGDHPHIVQEIEFKGDKTVFYSVGNYIFDQMWSIDTRQGVTIELNYIDKRLVNIRLHPHQLYLYDRGSVDLLKPEQPEYQQTLERAWGVSNFKE
jgi:hypothetical protein